mmetsp:Transcript_17443/g.29599  ORF Transcript_17443/g.29599 Transcript_17443/m.29599 type:complete len:256 (+) Transcript_17443:135-902(+)
MPFSEMMTMTMMIITTTALPLPSTITTTNENDMLGSMRRRVIVDHHRIDCAWMAAISMFIGTTIALSLRAIHRICPRNTNSMICWTFMVGRVGKIRPNTFDTTTIFGWASLTEMVLYPMHQNRMGHRTISPHHHANETFKNRFVLWEIVTHDISTMNRSSSLTTSRSVWAMVVCTISTKRRTIDTIVSVTSSYCLPMNGWPKTKKKKPNGNRSWRNVLILFCRMGIGNRVGHESMPRHPTTFETKQGNFCIHWNG